ncbi:hypothetical protein C9E82_06685 [Paracoccus siganidrum]|uniref:Uncharacterized protein n=1 Tax=Paracoccus siganidrum TaxID=1276757 RepID=A0A418ZS50_9RHOB|nr:hypothetical protein D3P05_23000 [Paracoccus siganidrum]RMC39012.1 hypothetical protein C9E82_06685 [Paracoccus siganidrum]
MLIQYLMVFAQFQTQQRKKMVHSGIETLTQGLFPETRIGRIDRIEIPGMGGIKLVAQLLGHVGKNNLRFAADLSLEVIECRINRPPVEARESHAVPRPKASTRAVIEEEPENALCHADNLDAW